MPSPFAGMGISRHFQVGTMKAVHRCIPVRQRAPIFLKPDLDESGLGDLLLDCLKVPLVLPGVRQLAALVD